MGMTFVKLAKFEKEQSTCSSQRSRAADINNFANAVVKVSRCQSRLDAEIVKHLVRGGSWNETDISLDIGLLDYFVS